jgi:sugar/nucleoside kinase (ribokinase family)
MDALNGLPPSVLVCGNPTIDEIELPEKAEVSPGGSALFASCAAAYLGSKVGILGNIGGDYSDSALRSLRELRIETGWLRKTAKRSTRFHISQINSSRSIRLIEPGARILAPTSRRSFKGIHLGPVFNEIPAHLVQTLRERCDFLSADLQGFVRTRSINGQVRLISKDLRQLFSKCNMVQASIDEASVQTHSKNPHRMLAQLLAFKVKFAIITMGDQGSWLASQDFRRFRVPAFHDDETRDATGAGDVYAGSWLHTYLMTKDPVWASAVGSAFASLASRRTGLAKFRLERRELFRRAGWVYGHVKII